MIQLVDLIDLKLRESNDRTLSFGQLVMAMVINGLGFTGRTLHMYSEYFKDKPLERLIGEGVKAEQINQLFITRVPQTLKEAKTLIKLAPTLSFTPLSSGYEGVFHECEYGGVKQKWLLVRSEQAAKRETHTLSKRMHKQAEQARKSFKQLSQKIFACEVDAQKSLEEWEKKQILCKKPERIEALLMVMTVCLMVYAALEHQIRKQLVEQEQYFPDMKYKPHQKPTARWVFQCFQGITIMYINQDTVIVANLEDRNHTIIDCLGYHYQKIYS
ncbi:DUF4277 domain-containing protein (plasmid) [Catenovulum adriaticum]|uniref:DUF4277 domain-containing protein n=1 Tax=Catenovulum adriaticum TaxID=2984846 RepID=A0ABY7ARK5_9ALTE|nr:DUF4277 domain-containing protein [Catenovulum sp. TS8]